MKTKPDQFGRIKSGDVYADEEATAVARSLRADGIRALIQSKTMTVVRRETLLTTLKAIKLDRDADKKMDALVADVLGGRIMTRSKGLILIDMGSKAVFYTDTGQEAFASV